MEKVKEQIEREEAHRGEEEEGDISLVSSTESLTRADTQMESLDFDSPSFAAQSLTMSLGSNISTLLTGSLSEGDHLDAILSRFDSFPMTPADSSRIPFAIAGASKESADKVVAATLEVGAYDIRFGTSADEVRKEILAQDSKDNIKGQKRQIENDVDLDAQTTKKIEESPPKKQRIDAGADVTVTPAAKEDLMVLEQIDVIAVESKPDVQTKPKLEKRSSSKAKVVTKKSSVESSSSSSILSFFSPLK
jgi:hypothetical protein